MIVVRDIEQGTDEWFRLRMGIPTASVFDKLVTGTGKKSTQAKTLMGRLLAEWYMNKPYDGFPGNEHTERGNDMEGEARALYEFLHEVDVDQVTLVYKDDRRLVSCSPDGLLHNEEDVIYKGLEIKCPTPQVHMEYLISGTIPAKYVPQVQGSMYVTGMEEWDFMSYHPDLPPHIVTIKRDEKFIENLDEAMTSFLFDMGKHRAELLLRRKSVEV
jgi:hypothetical protein